MTKLISVISSKYQINQTHGKISPHRDMEIYGRKLIYYLTMVSGTLLVDKMKTNLYRNWILTLNLELCVLFSVRRFN